VARRIAKVVEVELQLALRAQGAEVLLERVEVAAVER
jgi:hypothetical protein